MQQKEVLKLLGSGSDPAKQHHLNQQARYTIYSDVIGQSVREYDIIWSQIKVPLGNDSFESQVHLTDE